MSVAFQHVVVAIAALAALCVLLLVVYRLDWGIWLFVSLAPFETVLGIDFQVTKAAKIALVTFITLLLLAETFSQPGSNRLKVDPYRKIFWLFLGTGLIATLQAASLVRSSLGLLALSSYVFYYIALSGWRPLVSRGPLLLRTLLALSAPLAVLSLMQLFIGYGGILGSREQKAAEAQGVLSTFWPNITRASGTFGSSNAAGAFLALTALIALVCFLDNRERQWRYLVSSGLSAAGVLATFSRGALLGMIAGTVFALCMYGRFRTVFLFISAILMTAGILIFTAGGTLRYLRIGSDVASASLSRVGAWKAAISIVGTHLTTGLGFYEFQQASQKFENKTDTATHPHNGLLKALVEQGILGGLAYLLLLVTFLRTSIRYWGTLSSTSLKWLWAGIACCGVSLFTQELFDAGLTVGSSSIAMVFVTLLALQTRIQNFNMSEVRLDNFLKLHEQI